jgi:hypothetical protein
LLLAGLAWGADGVQADNVCQKTSTDGCWVFTYLGAVDLGGGVTQLTFDILPTTACAHNVSYVAFGFPAGWGISSPAHGSTYTGPNTGYAFAVSVPAGGQINDPTSIKFQPPGATWSPGTTERFIFNVTGYNTTDPIHAYGHAGGGPTPQQVTFTNLAQACTPNAVTLTEMEGTYDMTPTVGFVLAATSLLVGLAGIGVTYRRVRS